MQALNYYLPYSLIASKPASPRDSCKLLVIDRIRKTTSHHKFSHIGQFLKKGDLLVFNKTKVFPARLFAKKETGGKLEILFLEEESPFIWQVLTKPGLKEGQKASLKELQIISIKQEENHTKIKVNLPKEKVIKFLEKYGKTPLPPYIKTKDRESKLRKSYQTIYAKEIGSAAAPTAGLHFTKRLIKKLKKKGVKIKYLTLHVGIGTFAPIKTKDIRDHKMHSEYFEIDKKTKQAIFKAKAQGKRIIAVGTTTTRVLETLAKDKRKTSGKTDIFIYPPYKFELTDGIITNFHLPKSTLLAMVSAFVSYPQTKERFKNFQESLLGRAYREAIKNKYRFFSFGDACLIL